MKFEGKPFKNETIDIDFNQFRNCQFDGCTLVFHGYGAIVFKGCSFKDVKWSITDAAAVTVTFMQGLYHGCGEGGKALIEETFNDIRKAPIDRKKWSDPLELDRKRGEVRMPM